MGAILWTWKQLHAGAVWTTLFSFSVGWVHALPMQAWLLGWINDKRPAGLLSFIRGFWLNSLVLYRELWLDDHPDLIIYSSVVCHIRLHLWFTRILSSDRPAGYAWFEGEGHKKRFLLWQCSNPIDKTPGPSGVKALLRLYKQNGLSPI